MEPLRWGILGAARFAREHMAPAIAGAAGARLVALATSTPEKAAPFAAFAHPLRRHETYGALLADPEVEAVYIPLPNHLHVEWTLKALAAGKHVLTEKPIAMRADEIDRIVALRDRTGLHAAEAFMILHHPQWQRVRELVQGGAIGTLRHVDAAFSYDNRAEISNIRNRAETGGGGLRDIGVYTCGSLRFATGAEPLDLEARVQRENGVDTWALVTGRMGGPGGSFTFASMTSMRLFPRQEVVLQGDLGLIRVPAPFNAGIFGEARIELHRPGSSMTLERFPTARQYRLQIEAFARTVRDGMPYPCPLEFSRGTQRMLDRIFEVAREIPPDDRNGPRGADQGQNPAGGAI